MEKGVRVYSEIGKLRKVILHRPGEEINNVSPDTMQELLLTKYLIWIKHLRNMITLQTY